MRNPINVVSKLNLFFIDFVNSVTLLLKRPSYFKEIMNLKKNSRKFTRTEKILGKLWIIFEEIRENFFVIMKFHVEI